MEFLFLVSIFLVFYVYFGYPVLLWFISLVVGRTVATEIPKEEGLPIITVIIPAYNECKCIKETVKNKLDSNYPSDKLQVIVVSDASTDGTDDIIKGMSAIDSRVSLLRQLTRQGKTAGVNKAVELAKGDVLVFADANSMYSSSTIIELTNALQNNNVGYVTGKMVYVDSSGSLIGDGTSAYMRYENTLRSMESRVGSLVGVDGGVDAMWKYLYIPLGSDQLPDFVQPLKCIEQGYRVVYRESALLYEESLSDEATEFNMRVRVSLRAYWAMWNMRSLFNPVKYGMYSWQLISHKLLRYMVMVFLFAALVSNAVLSLKSALFLILFVGQILFYVLAIIGRVKKQAAPSLARFAFYFCLLNVASGVALISFLRGKKIVTWKPRQGQ